MIIFEVYLTERHCLHFAITWFMARFHMFVCTCTCVTELTCTYPVQQVECVCDLYVLDSDTVYIHIYSNEVHECTNIFAEAQVLSR